MIENTRFSDTDKRPRLETLTKFITGRTLLCLVWILSVILFAARVHEGYVSVDDPLLAHAAERTLNGEVPHVDFHDGYTGGLSYLHALALRLFGIRLISLRFMLFFLFALWVPAFWYIASRITSSPTASLITLLAVVWSVPIYPSPVGSWYSLYFATFSVAALVRFIETRHSAWIILAGLSSGFSFLAKLSGLYLLAGLGLFLIFDEQSESNSALPQPRTWSSYLYVVLMTLAILALDGILVFFVHTHLNTTEFYHFLLPGFSLSTVLLAREWRKPTSMLLVRVRRLGSRALPLLFGFVTPVVIFLIPYLYRGAVKKFLFEVFVLPKARLQFVYGPAIHPVGALSCIPLLVLLLLDIELSRRKSRHIAGGIVTLVLAALFIESLQNVTMARWIWIAAAVTIPVIVALGSIVLLRSQAESKEASTLLLLVSVAALCSLGQFPYFAPMYFCYVAPLAILAFTSLHIQVRRNDFPSFLVPVALFYCIFGIFVMMPAQIYNQALSFKPLPEQAFTLSRAGGLLGSRSIVVITEEAVSVLLAHSGNAPIYAGPDSPEFYFLSGLKNCTPNLIEFSSGPDGEPSHIVMSIERTGVKAVLLNHTPGNDSGPLPSDLEAKLRARFPESATIGPLEVRWRQ